MLLRVRGLGDGWQALGDLADPAGGCRYVCVLRLQPQPTAEELGVVTKVPDIRPIVPALVVTGAAFGCAEGLGDEFLRESGDDALATGLEIVGGGKAIGDAVVGGLRSVGKGILSDIF